MWSFANFGAAAFPFIVGGLFLFFGVIFFADYSAGECGGRILILVLLGGGIRLWMSAIARKRRNMDRVAHLAPPHRRRRTPLESSGGVTSIIAEGSSFASE